MAVISGASNTALNLGTAQTGNVDTTNTAFRSSAGGGGAVIINSTAGGTPTVTVNILGSVDGTNFYNIPYTLVATSETIAVAAITITTTVVTTYLLRPGHAWRFLKLNYSANTNMTMTADAYLA